MSRKRVCRICTWIAALLLVLATMAQPVLAYDGMYTRPTGTLIFNYYYQKQPVAGVYYNLYQVAAFDEGGGLVFTSDYWTEHIHMNEGFEQTSAEVKKALAATMAYGLYRHPEIAPIRTTETDEEGHAIFYGLQEGYYLAVAENKEIGEYAYRNEPTLLTLRAGEGESEFYVDVNARFVGGPIRSSETEHSVRKVWVDTGAENERPESVEVQLTRNGYPYGDPVTLTAENNWEYKWASLPYGNDVVYSVIELTNLREIGYRTISNTNEDTLVTTITNEKVSDWVRPEENPPEVPVENAVGGEGEAVNPGENPPEAEAGENVEEEPKVERISVQGVNKSNLPRIGVLWWPVPILFAGGIILYTAGYIIENKKNW